MSRVDDRFAELRAQGQGTLIPFITGGDPDVASLPEILRGIDRAGAGVIEIGIPFSDPIADGPVIQASMQRALDGGATVDGIFSALAGVHAELTSPLVAMVSYSIVHRLGLEPFLDRAKQSGIAGVIFPDLSLEESGPAQRAAAQRDMSLIHLIAPTTPMDRAKRLAEASTGFTYIVSRAGITGVSTALPEDLPDRLAALREVTDNPLAVGFGVKDANQVRMIADHADAAIVGSALVKAINEAFIKGVNPAKTAKNFISELASSL